MTRAKRGNIIHVGSIASYEAVGSVGYNTVKAGICGYVRSIGREVLKDGIILSGILQGGFISDRMQWTDCEAEIPRHTKILLKKGFLEGKWEKPKN